MKILFLDESGDHNLTTIDSNYPVFVLAGCVIDEEYHKRQVTVELDAVKEELFNKKDIVFHYVDYTRNRNGFERISDKQFREKFYSKLNELIEETDFSLIACIIDKMKLHGLTTMVSSFSSAKSPEASACAKHVINRHGYSPYW